VTSQWRDNWQSVTVVNSHPTQLHSLVSTSPATLVAVNYFWTGHSNSVVVVMPSAKQMIQVTNKQL